MSIVCGHAVSIPWQSAVGIATHHEILPDGATTDIDVGSVSADIAIIVSYSATRGATYQMGTVFILDDGVPDYNWDHYGDDIGVTLSGAIVGNDILLRCVVDASSADDVIFDYLIEKIKQ